MAATAVRPKVAPPAEEPAPPVEETGMMALALKVWQRGSCPEDALDQEWVSAEECILIPH